MSNSSELRTIRVFISSPGDVQEERQRAFQVIEQLNNDPHIKEQAIVEAVAWDRPGTYLPASVMSHPTEEIDQNLTRPEQCDFVVIILCNQIGTPLPEEYVKPAAFQYETGYEDLPPERYLSGTEYEFVNAMESLTNSGRPVTWTYKCNNELQISPSDPNRKWLLKQYDLVNAFFGQFNNPDGSIRWSYNPYETLDEFEKSLRLALKTNIQKLLADTVYVLCVESDDVIGMLWERLFDYFGFDCLVINNVREARRKVIGSKLDEREIIIIGTQFLDTEAKDLALAFRKAEIKTPILFAGDNKITLKEVRRLHADIISHPFYEYEMLEKKIRRLVGLERSKVQVTLPKFVWVSSDPGIVKVLENPDIFGFVESFSSMFFSDAKDAVENILRNDPPLDTAEGILFDEGGRVNMTGLEFAKALREAGESRPIIITSAYQPPPRKELERLNTEFLPKPFDFAGISYKLAKWDSEN